MGGWSYLLVFLELFGFGSGGGACGGGGDDGHCVLGSVGRFDFDFLLWYFLFFSGLLLLVGMFLGVLGWGIRVWKTLEKLFEFEVLKLDQRL